MTEANDDTRRTIEASDDTRRITEASSGTQPVSAPAGNLPAPGYPVSEAAVSR